MSLIRTFPTSQLSFFFFGVHQSYFVNTFFVPYLFVHFLCISLSLSLCLCLLSLCIFCHRSGGSFAACRALLLENTRTLRVVSSISELSPFISLRYFLLKNVVVIVPTPTIPSILRPGDAGVVPYSATFVVGQSGRRLCKRCVIFFNRRLIVVCSTGEGKPSRGRASLVLD